MDINTRVTAVEEFLKTKMGYVAPSDPKPSSSSSAPVEGVTVVNNLSEIKTSGNYRLNPSTFGMSSGYFLPNDVKVDVSGSVFNFAGTDWTCVFEFSDKSNNVTVIGGTYYLPNKNNLIFNSNGSKNITMKNQTLAPNSGWGYKVTGGENVTLDGLTATTWYNYAVFAEGDSKNLTIKNWKIDGGSTNESTIRVCGVIGLTIKDCHLFCDQNFSGAQKHVALRLHEGENYTLENIEVRGIVGMGPMGGGDGGQQWGFTQFIGKNGEWQVPKEQADMGKTLAHRAKSLALRTKKIRIKNMKIIEGKIQCNPGLIDAQWDGGSLTNTIFPPPPAIVSWGKSNDAFYNMFKTYPDGLSIYSNKLDTDTVRPTADLIVTNVAFYANAIDPSGIVKLREGVTFTQR